MGQQSERGERRRSEVKGNFAPWLPPVNPYGAAFGACAALPLLDGLRELIPTGGFNMSSTTER
jgi:hypothetical protein